MWRTEILLDSQLGQVIYELQICARKTGNWKHLVLQQIGALRDCSTYFSILVK